MLAQWNQIESKVDALLRQLVSLKAERSGLQDEVRKLQTQVTRYEGEREELRTRMDGLLEELKQLESEVGESGE